LYLSKLEIFGFKSFANKTIVNFTKGITGIVGPNGCGKTNIVDAIRWCLGEQKSSVLRSDKMESVIFNGTHRKKPMGMAEVSLTLVNDKGILPTEFSEVTITRRIFRSGESEYLLNGNLCRLKDITNLFMDTGMGTNAYSVIELKMIETILSNRADERRNMFEEAAGVNKYKLRRRLALKKLDDVKGDLNRVNDIVAEVEKKVNSLERQAKKADKYNTYSTVLKEKEIDLGERQFSLYSNQRATIGLEIASLSNRKEEIDVEIREIEDELIVYRDQAAEVEVELTKKRSELNKQTEKLHNAQKNISVAEERKKALVRNIERFKQELEELHFQAGETEDIILENKDTIVEIRENIVVKESEIDGSDEFIQTKIDAVEKKKQHLKTQSDEILKQFKGIHQQENNLKNFQKSLKKNNQQLEKQNNRIQKITSDIAKRVGYLEELTTEKDQLVLRLKETEDLFASRQKEKEELEEKLASLKENEFEERGLMNNLKNKIDFLQSLIANLEDISKGSKTLIESEEWTDRERNLFADVGNSDDEHRFAVEAALKFVLNNLLVENHDELSRAVEYLKTNDLGKASFYLLNHTKDKKTFLNKIANYRFNKTLKRLQQEKTFVAWAHQLIHAKDLWQPYFKTALEKTVITNTLEDAFELNKKYPEFTFATMEGDLVMNNGIIEAGSTPKNEESLFGRKQMLEELEKEYPKYETNLLKLQEMIQETEEALSVIDLKEFVDQSKLLTNDLNNIEKQISQLNFEKEKSDEEVEKIQTDIQELVTESNSLEEQIGKLSAEIESQHEARKIEEDKLKNIETELKEVEEDYNNTITIYNQKKVELERLLGKFQNTENAIKRAEQQKETIAHTIEKRDKDITTTTEEISSIQIIIEDNQIEYDEIYEVRSVLVDEEKSIHNRLKAIKEEASVFEKKLQLYRKEREQISDKIHTLDLQINKLNMKLENLVEHIKEEYSLELELKEYEDLDDFNFQERSAEVSDLKSKLKNLGPINLLAYSEYEEEKERLDFLHKQRNDLIDSERDLVKTIQEINTTAQELFRETFEAIRQNFINIFRTLFNPGDEADLKIEEDVDPLEAKIEIVAKPKGKRPTSIELLSGGEKTLTATALLFAIYLVKPSPFCILDEVDAPLDDANVDRYTRLISEFSSNTQFIMVTHNKRTMEAAENMYGVTMQEEGISKLVGVQFNEQVNASA